MSLVACACRRGERSMQGTVQLPKLSDTTRAARRPVNRLQRQLNVLISSAGASLLTFPSAAPQGGICGVFDANDSVASHVSDTVVAGAYLCNLPAVEVRLGTRARLPAWRLTRQPPLPSTALRQLTTTCLPPPLRSSAVRAPPP